VSISLLNKTQKNKWLKQTARIWSVNLRIPKIAGAPSTNIPWLSANAGRSSNGKRLNARVLRKQIYFDVCYCDTCFAFISRTATSIYKLTYCCFQMALSDNKTAQMATQAGVDSAVSRCPAWALSSSTSCWGALGPSHPSSNRSSFMLQYMFHIYYLLCSSSILIVPFHLFLITCAELNAVGFMTTSK
jgi:hypothetical protein